MRLKRTRKMIPFLPVHHSQNSSRQTTLGTKIGKNKQRTPSFGVHNQHPLSTRVVAMTPPETKTP
jgi:hypothetical protein